MKDDFEYWKEYIRKHRSSDLSDPDESSAPYRDVFVCGNLNSPFETFVYFHTKGRFSYWHRVDGPAIIFAGGRAPQYWVNNKSITKEEFDEHPLVIEYRLGQMIAEVLDEDP